MKLRALCVVSAAALVLAACSSGDDSEPDPEQKEGSDLVQISPLTGERLENGLPDHAPFAVKIDNTSQGRTQTGLDQADLVVEETVEGGATRLAALFYSQLPEQVGYVRSMRATDIGIALPASAHLVASGGAGPTVDRMGQAGVSLVTEDGGNAGFSRQQGKAAPYNVLIDLAQTGAEAETTKPSTPYLPWAEDADDATTSETAASAASVRFSNFHTTEWAHGDGGWTRTNGLAEPEFAARNMLVLFADEKDAGYTDPAGNPVPETDFVGEGRAVVFAGGSVIEGTWSKADHGSQIQLADADGGQIELAPGKTWIELVNASTADVTWS